MPRILEVSNDWREAGRELDVRGHKMTAGQQLAGMCGCRITKRGVEDDNY